MESESSPDRSVGKAPKILKRCTICKKYHAAYRVNAQEAGGQEYLCYECWTRYEAQRLRAGQEQPDQPREQENSLNLKDETGNI